MGKPLAGAVDIRNVALPVLEKLREQTDLTCHLGILDEVAPIYVLNENTQPIGIRKTGWVKAASAQFWGGKALCGYLQKNRPAVTGREASELYRYDYHQ